MEEKSLDTALEIYSVLAQGKSLKSDEAETAELYQAYYSDAEVYDITARLLAKLGLKAYEYKDAVFVTAGAGNKVFGLTNEDIKKRLTLKTNRELYLVYFIMYQALLMFYTDSASVQVREYVRLDEMMKAVTEGLGLLFPKRWHRMWREWKKLPLRQCTFFGRVCHRCRRKTELVTVLPVVLGWDM